MQFHMINSVFKANLNKENEKLCILVNIILVISYFSTNRALYLRGLDLNSEKYLAEKIQIEVEVDQLFGSTNKIHMKSVYPLHASVDLYYTMPHPQTPPPPPPHLVTR